MDLNDETISMLYKKYSVYYNFSFDAWMRDKKCNSNKDFELGDITEIITGDNILLKNNSFIDEKEEGIKGNICVCGCDKCGKLYKLYHLQTKTAFMVGSSCITKAGHIEFINDMICADKNGRCYKCNVPLRYKGYRKNSKKKYNGFCYKCRTKVIIALKISYDEKDIYKKYGTKWNPTLKTWYWEGYEDEFPKILKTKYWLKTIITDEDDEDDDEDDFRSDSEDEKNNEDIINEYFHFRIF